MDEDAYRRWLSRLPGDVTYRQQVHTPSGLPVELTYGPWSVTGSYEEKLGFPGEYPFTRGIYPAGYRGKL
ncbi:Pivaloyl-CoA mutase large subunit [bacterium HR09]|nr:Pivaloyl-CoA mutase large subunit [bacterium HR09]